MRVKRYFLTMKPAKTTAATLPQTIPTIKPPEMPPDEPASSVVTVGDVEDFGSHILSASSW